MFLKERQAKGDTKTPSSVLLDAGTTQDGTNEVMALFEGAKAFGYPKPVSLLKQILQFGTDENSLILDFFAGSGTTAHAVYEANYRDGGKRRFILVQLPERAEGQHDNIAALMRERVRRAGMRLMKERNTRLNVIGNSAPDLGFRAYCLATSNFKPWDGDPARFAADPAQQGLFGPVARQLQMAADNLLPDRTADDILAEILLKAGFELTEPTERLALAGKTVFSVAGGALLVCLDRNLTLEVIEAMAARDPAQIVVLDAGFKGDDRLRVNAVQTVRARVRGAESSIAFKVV